MGNQPTLKAQNVWQALPVQDFLQLITAGDGVISWIDSFGALQNLQSPVAFYRDALSGTYVFKRIDGSGGTVIQLLNSQSPGIDNAIHTIGINTDGQANYSTLYANGNPSSRLILDEDGHFQLASAAANGTPNGGIGTDQNTGHTGIPALVAGGLPSYALMISNTGQIVSYLGQTLSGNGFRGGIVFNGSSSLTGNLSNFVLFTTNASGYASRGMYKVTGYMVATGTAGGATMTVTVSYTDDNGARTQSTAALPFAAAGNIVTYEFIVQSVPSSPIKISFATAAGQTYTEYANLSVI